LPRSISHESGSGTAIGQKLDREALTAAHRTLPFGSKVKVTNKSNGRSVVVTINDGLGIHRAYASEHRRRSIARRSTLEDVDDIFLAGPTHDTRAEPDIERVCHGLFRSRAASTARPKRSAA
jgi:hypothetical protein